MKSLIDKLSDDCLELVFAYASGTPDKWCTIASVCRRWYNIAQRPSVWRTLNICPPYRHSAYSQFLASEYNKGRLASVQTLRITKPPETRHGHPKSLPFDALVNATHVETSNLCLAEIGFLLKQLEKVTHRLQSIECKNIETWCDTQQFSTDLFSGHTQLRKVHFQFNEDGHSGFASMQNTSEVPLSEENSIQSLVLTSVRDFEDVEQLNLLEKLHMVETDMDEVFTPEQVQQVEQQKQALLQIWEDIEQRLLRKYTYMERLKNLHHLDFGFCYAWTPSIWHKFFSVVESSPNLSYLGLHGWDQLRKFGKIGVRSTTIQPIRIDAETAIAECFEAMPNLVTLRLVDFAIGPGLLKAAKVMGRSIQHLKICFSRYWVNLITEQADIWHLVGPIKELVSQVFFEHSNKPRSCTIYLNAQIVDKINSNPFFKEEPLFESIRDAVKEKNVHVEIVQHFEYNT